MNLNVVRAWGPPSRVDSRGVSARIWRQYLRTLGFVSGCFTAVSRAGADSARDLPFRGFAAAVELGFGQVLQYRQRDWWPRHLAAAYSQCLRSED